MRSLAHIPCLATVFHGSLSVQAPVILFEDLLRSEASLPPSSKKQRAANPVFIPCWDNKVSHPSTWLASEIFNPSPLHTKSYWEVTKQCLWQPLGTEFGRGMLEKSESTLDIKISESTTFTKVLGLKTKSRRFYEHGQNLAFSCLINYGWSSYHKSTVIGRKIGLPLKNTGWNSPSWMCS